MRYVLLAAALACAACGGGGGGARPAADDAECVRPGARHATAPDLPPNFPIPDGVTVYRSRVAGPTTLVDGYSAKRIPELFEEWRAALDRPPYSVLKSEREARDAEVNFSGEDTTGQVRLGIECEDVTSVQITARPL